MTDALSKLNDINSNLGNASENLIDEEEVIEILIQQKTNKV
jgi:hypothetical protein